MNFKVYVTDEEYTGNPIFVEVEQFETKNERAAIKQAKLYAATYHGQNVYIFVDGNNGTGFLNPSGFGLDAENWVN